MHLGALRLLGARAQIVEVARGHGSTGSAVAITDVPTAKRWPAGAQTPGASCDPSADFLDDAEGFEEPPESDGGMSAVRHALRENNRRHDR